MTTKPSKPSAPSKAQSTRDRMLEVALDLFHQKGVRAVSVDEILEKSDTGKSQFYHYFGSKDGIVKAVVEQFKGMLQRQELPMQYEVKTLGQLRKWFQGFIEFQRMTNCARTCPMATIAGGLEEPQEAIRQDIEHIFTASREVLDTFFDGLAKEKKLPKGTHPRELSDFCYSIMQGGLVVSKVKKDVRPFEHSVKHALAYIKSLIEE